MIKLTDILKENKKPIKEFALASLALGFLMKKYIIPFCLNKSGCVLSSNIMAATLTAIIPKLDPTFDFVLFGSAR